jgi:tRNA-uridine 2-sulfurtransferase
MAGPRGSAGRWRVRGARPTVARFAAPALALRQALPRAPMHLPDVPGRIVVAMSGGVDSSVAAWLLREAGADVVGLFMRNGVHVGEEDAGKKSCCSVGDARDARMVAAGLGVPFQAVDLKEEFGGIIRYFLAEYARGRTPNPCAVCNRDLKFRRLMRFADELGAEGVATGHYARIERGRGTVAVYRGRDEHKDQSYQLFSVAEADLARTWLPLGGYTKPEVRGLAEQAGLRTAKKKDSQEICFVPSNDYRKLLAERGVELHPGLLVDTAGAVLGRHAGTEHFTIGQRRGHGVAGGTPLFVVELQPETGTVVLGTKSECGARELALEDLNLIGFAPPGSGAFRAAVQVRYHHDPAPAEIIPEGSGARVVFDEPVLAVAPGQGAAFYDGPRLLGGGWIARADRG